MRQWRTELKKSFEVSLINAVLNDISLIDYDTETFTIVYFWYVNGFNGMINASYLYWIFQSITVCYGTFCTSENYFNPLTEYKNKEISKKNIFIL